MSASARTACTLVASLSVVLQWFPEAGAGCSVHCARGALWQEGDTMLKVVNRLVNSEVNRLFCMNKVRGGGGGGRRKYSTMYSGVEPVFLNVYGAQESIPRNEFRQPM